MRLPKLPYIARVRQKLGGGIGRTVADRQALRAIFPAGPILTLAALSLAALSLAACGGGGPVADAPPTSCPRVAIVTEAARVVQFGPGAGRDPTDIVSRGQIADYNGTCTYGDGRVTVDLTVDIVGERGPAGSGGDLPLQYFVAIADPTQAIIAKQVFDTSIALADGASRGGVREQLTQRIPLPDAALGPRYQVLVGFQLTPEQLDYNRR